MAASYKMYRAFAGHAEALKKYRSSGEQKVTVTYVERAFVGTVTQAADEPPVAAAHEVKALTHDPVEAMKLIDGTASGKSAAPVRRRARK